MASRETKLNFFVRFKSKSKLEPSTVKSVFKLLKTLLPDGILSSIQVEKGEEGLTPVSLIHKIKNNIHFYEIPLTRKLLKSEFTELTNGFNVSAIEGLSLEASILDLDSTRHLLTGEPKIEDDFYNVMCDMLAQYQHSNWCSEKTAEGWRFGFEYSEANKMTPLLRPWSDLPSEYKKVDRRLPIEFAKMINNLGFVFIKKEELADLLNHYETISISKTS